MTTDITTLAPAGLSLPGGLPALITTAGERTAWRFVEFFTATIRNPNTREAYARAVVRFLAWCEGRGLKDLRALTPVVVAAYIEQLPGSKPTVKQHLSAIRMIKRRGRRMNLPPGICCHTFRATGITAYLENGGTIEHA